MSSVLSSGGNAGATDDPLLHRITRAPGQRRKIYDSNVLNLKLTTDYTIRMCD